MKNLLVILILAVTGIACYAQQCTISGKVVDKNTGAPLPFVNMIVAGYPQTGTTADIDGKFSISAPFQIKALSFSYIGYRDTTIAVSYKSMTNNCYILNINVALQQSGLTLQEVKVFPGVNPALRIIRMAIEHKDRNNPEKIHSFTYYSYNKLYCTADIKGATDTVNSLDTLSKSHPSKADTQNVESLHNRDTAHHHHSLKRILQRQYFFLMESVSERRYLYPGHNYEKVLASRTSGLKDSPFALLAQQLQSFSFYPDNITILDEQYLNPISGAGIKRYYFIIEDTLYNGKDTVFVISFNPKQDKNFNAMRGVVYVNTNGYAIQNVIAQPILQDQTISIHIQQKYEFIAPDSTHPSHTNPGLWFPVQLNTDWVYNNSYVGDTAITIAPKGIFNTTDEYNKIKVVSRSYIKDIVLDTALPKRDFGRVEVEVANNASSQPDAFWDKFRGDSLSSKEKRTYRVIDSMGKKEHFDRKLKWYETLSTGELKTGFLNWDISKFLNYNGYEKFRLGAGVHTNDEVSNFFTVGGYGAYGTGDHAFKYGGDVGFIFDPYNHVKLDFAYQQDVIGAGTVTFYNNQSLLSTENYYNYFINNMDKMRKETVSFSFDALRYFQFNFFGDEQLRTVTNSYQFISFNDNIPSYSNVYNFTEAGVGFRFAYREDFLKSPFGMISLGTDYPIVWGNITQGFDDLLKGGYEYTKYDLKISKDFPIPEAGYSSLTLLGGYVQGNVPYTLLYNARATYEPVSSGTFPLAVDNTFETMRINEFLSNRYVNIFYFHNFQSYLFRHKNFRPELKFVTNAGWGALANPASQSGITYKTMSQGYYESGLEINKLLHSGFLFLGIGGYYRYGPYSLSTPIDNFAFKLTVTLSFN